MDKNYYDVIIVGGGPAGIFTALELAGQTGWRVLLVEKGKDIDQRRCLARDDSGACAKCAPCNLVCGLGGAGAFSDGKLVLSTCTGGQLTDYIGETATDTLIKYVDSVYLNFGAPDHLYQDGEYIEELRHRAALAELRLVPAVIRHLGTEHCYSVLKAMRDYLASRVEFKLGVPACTVVAENGVVKGIETKSGEKLLCKYLVLAPGREGADWLSREAGRLHLTMHNNPVDVGVRVEVPAAVLKKMTDVLYEVKLEYQSPTFDDRIRTFCMCPGGEVIMEATGGADQVITVNGHSYADSKTDYTNFAVLVSTNFTEPFREPIAYGKYIARLANLLSGGVLVQRLGDLMKGQRSTPERIARGMVQPTLKTATPGDLSFVLPYRQLTGIVEMLQAMDKLIPGIASCHTLLYGVEVKFYSCRPQLSPALETEVRNLFAIGDGTGVSRGLVQASASGVVAAREILQRGK
ncbi:MAG: FAD-dependent oxidoreductase [Dehalococcoidales bacterium]|nr:FAD-dependent oxidoreductase [Dehalococcoidales bacterium]